MDIPVIHPVYVQLSAQSASVVPVSRVGIFFDTDPGRQWHQHTHHQCHQHHTKFTVPLGTVSEGFHSLYIRAKDSNGSGYSGHRCLSEQCAVGTHACLKTLRVFIDTDPVSAMPDSCVITSALPKVSSSTRQCAGWLSYTLPAHADKRTLEPALARPSCAAVAGTVITAFEYF